MSTLARHTLLRTVGVPILCVLVSCELHGSDGEQPVQKSLPKPERRAMSQPPETLDARLASMVAAARSDLVERQEGKLVEADIQVLVAKRVTWRSSALGCPQPDRGYKMVLTPGVRIVLRAEGVTYEFHSTPAGPPFLCEPPATIETPAPSSNSLDPT